MYLVVFFFVVPCKNTAQINLIVAGSVNTLMNKIFKDKKQPLFGRQTATMQVRPFKPSVLKEIIIILLLLIIIMKLLKTAILCKNRIMIFCKSQVANGDRTQSYTLLYIFLFVLSRDFLIFLHFYVIFMQKSIIIKKKSKI